MSPALPTMTARRAVALAIALLVAACASPPHGSTRAAQIPPDRLIRIATQTPLSGGQASLGESIRLAVELAVEKHRAPLERAGFAVEVVAMDDQARPDVGVANARRLVADPAVLLVVGHLNSGVAIPASEVYQAARLAMIGPALTNPAVTDRGLPNVYRVIGRDDVQGGVAAQFAVRQLGAKSAYVLHDTTTYGRGTAATFQQACERLGVRVLGVVGTMERRNFGAVIAGWALLRPDVIFVGGTHELAAPLLRQARALGIQVSFLGPDGLDHSDLVRLGGDAVVGTHFVAVVDGMHVPPPFAEEFRRRFGKDAVVFAAQGYDAAWAGLEALRVVIEKSAMRRPSREEVIAEIRRVRLQGLTGPIEFDDRGDLRQARYFVIRVDSADPQRWDSNPTVQMIEAAPLR